MQVVLLMDKEISDAVNGLPEIWRAGFRSRFESLLTSALNHQAARLPADDVARTAEWELSDVQKCNAEWNERYQRMLQTEEELRAEIRGLRAFKSSVDEALNSGDGSYRP